MYVNDYKKNFRREDFGKFQLTVSYWKVGQKWYHISSYHNTMNLFSDYTKKITTLEVDKFKYYTLY